MIWQLTIAATIRALCATATACLATSSSLDQLAAGTPVPVVGDDGTVLR